MRGNSHVRFLEGWAGAIPPGHSTGWGQFGAKPAQSETPVRAAAKRRSTRKRAQWKEDAKLPSYLGLERVCNLCQSVVSECSQKA